MKNISEISQCDVFRWLRSPMIVYVAYANSYSGLAENNILLSLDRSSYEFFELLISQTLVKVGIPVFVCMLGYLFFSNRYYWNLEIYKSKLLRRTILRDQIIVSLLIPIIIYICGSEIIGNVVFGGFLPIHFTSVFAIRPHCLLYQLCLLLKNYLYIGIVFI